MHTYYIDLLHNINGVTSIGTLACNITSLPSNLTMRKSLLWEDLAMGGCDFTRFPHVRNLCTCTYSEWSLTYCNSIQFGSVLAHLLQTQALVWNVKCSSSAWLQDPLKRVRCIGWVDLWLMVGRKMEWGDDKPPKHSDGYHSPWNGAFLPV